MQAFEVSTCSDIPEGDRSAMVAHLPWFSTAGDGNRGYPALFSMERLKMLSAAVVPYTYGLAVATAGLSPAVGAKSDGSDLSSMPCGMRRQLPLR
jgi:hypothetical protein